MGILIIIIQYIWLALCFYYIHKQKKEIEYLMDTCVHYFADMDRKTEDLEEVLRDHLMVGHGYKRSDLDALQ